jgi:serralysin
MSLFNSEVRFGASAVDAPDTDDTTGVTGAQLSLSTRADDNHESPFDNGNSTPAVTIALTGNATIDGVLWGTKWNTTYITYSDPDSTADYQAGYSSGFLSTFGQISANQLTAVHAILNEAQYSQPTGALGLSVEAFTNLFIDYAGAGTGSSTIRLGNTSGVGTAQVADFPQNNIYGGDVWFGGSGRSPVTGNYDYYTTIHELGHALGLKHGHQAINNFGGGAPVLPYDTDSMEYSVMTYKSYVGSDAQFVYNETWGYAQTFMMYDIRALQQLYGADFNANGGNTTYSWNPLTGESYIDGNLALDPGANRIFMTIWDGNGVDTYDLSNYATNLSIDLNPGGYSTFSSAQRAYLGGGPNGGYARGNVFNALQYNGDARSLIENAVGGSGSDSIAGNAANNALTGNGGNDTLLGNSGIDTLQGGAGNDRLDGGLFADYAYGEDGNDTFVISGSDIADHVYGGNGTDTLDVSGYANTSLGFSINLQSGLYDFIPTAFGPFVVSSVENVLGSGRADTIIGSTVANNLAGNAGNDLIQGGGGNDIITGGDGNDTVQGGVGNDVVEGGTGADSENGGAGNDRLVLHVGFGVGNVWNGNDGIDTFDFRAIGAGYSGITIDLVAGYSDGAGSSTILNVENVWGSDSPERIVGNTGANQLLGYGGNDTILGGAGNDTVLGGTGNDSLVGGTGRDLLQGGAGQDRFDFNLVSESVVGANCDVLQAGGGGNAFDGAGGAAGGERIDLLDIDANITLAGNQAFLFGGTGKGHVWCVNAGNVTQVFANVDNDAAAEFQLNILDLGVVAGTYNAGDFIL